MSITKKDVEHVAKLARIELYEDEKEKFAGELSSILGFVETLNETGTSGITPVTGGSLLENETREDTQLEIALENKQAEMLAQAPYKKDTWIKVKAIFG